MSDIPRSVIIIPARLAATRLPNKLLLSETGKPLLQYAWEAACKSTLASEVIIACDHPLIYDAAVRFGARVEMTDPKATCGTDRITEVAKKLDAEIIVNVQADEPLMDPESIDTLIRLIANNEDASMATLAAPIRDKAALFNPSCVKVVCDRFGRALYFSRSVIPFPRDGVEQFLSLDPPLFLMHIGVYAFRRKQLLEYSELPIPKIEQAELLEQLRVLYNGCHIYVGQIDKKTMGVDTPKDYKKFVEIMRKKEAEKLARQS